MEALGKEKANSKEDPKVMTRLRQGGDNNGFAEVSDCFHNEFTIGFFVFFLFFRL